MYTLETLAKKTGARLVGDPSVEISSVADLESATFCDATFLANPRYASLVAKTEAGVVCVDPQAELIDGKNFLISGDPSRTFQEIAEAFLLARKTTGFSGIHPTAVVHDEATLEEGVTLLPYAVVDEGATIGSGSVIGPHAYVGAHVEIGKDCTLHHGACVREYCVLKNRVILQPGAVIGSCGFGYTTSPTGEHTKLEQIGNVVLEDDVEIGANSTIDRARFKTTWVHKGTKIDNLVQIAHNVEIGEHNIIAAQTGIAGSTKTGRNVMMGGQVGIVGHLEITDFVMIATRGGVSKSIPKSGKYAGAPVVTLSEHNRTQVYLRKIESLAKRVEELEKALSPCN